MKNYRNLVIILISYAYIFLFCYAAVSKLIDFELFQLQLGQSPIISTYAGFISYFVITIELLICGLLVFNNTRSTGLYLSTGLMVAFTVYIYLILNYADNIPCSCGGVLEKMTWSQHFIFNLIFVLLGIIAIALNNARKIAIKTTVLKLSSSIILPILLVVMLFSSSDYMSKKENPFIRKFIPHAIEKEGSINLGVNSYYFAGVSNDTLYLGNRTSPFLLTSVDSELKTMKEFPIAPQPNHYLFKRPQLFVNDGAYFLFDGTIPVIFKGDLNNKIARLILQKEFYFDLLNVGDNHLVFRSQTKNKGLILGQFDFNNSTLQLSDSILQKQTDGFFDVDGSLLHDPILKNHVYVYRYRNQFVVMDNSLQNIKYHSTIDTVSVAKVQSQELSNGQNKMNAPPLVVNSNGAVYDGVLFNISNIIGRFEDPKQWQNSFIIDLYSTKEQLYFGSFYLPKADGTSNAKIFINKNYLYVLQENEMLKYSFAQNVLKHFSNGESRKP
ncbi:MauE/DoxX family redox-associated membrane protein [Chryseobacterium sp. MFBS3-17]|uniref:MauE/DoxX family redox-associated membrane protein n=1 Tax=Chryseobacterium sp. MFBS3-17 TaxID=2886689 RepID=UPI001D0E0324|nr:MauE/DoxX family redox-associated membrane protein [Chryseobacterium sp. MFBS3-17]MCC2590311.1 tellurium resistance protein TerC [Chryseobacterium sp. MFBS3-17]